jgi:hypothetical protein
MTSLPELQQHVAEALRGRPDAAIRLVVGNGIDPAERLVGEDYFAQLADTYRQRHPSGSGDLQHVGAELPGFLQRRFAESDYAYLPEVAALEWAFQLAAIAPARNSRIVARLAEVDGADYESLSFELHPTAQLVASPFPVIDLWRANRDADASESELAIDLASGAQHVLLLRREIEVELLRLTAAEFQFLESLRQGQGLPDAIAAATAHDQGFDAAAALPRFVQLGVIIDCHVSGRPT